MDQAISNRPVLDPRSVHVRFVVEKEATEQGFLQELPIFPDSINQPLFVSHLELTFILLLP